VSLGAAISLGFQKYSDFTGRSTRSEFWWFQLFLILGFLIVGTLWGPLSTVWFLATAVPYFASAVRRLRDAGFPFGLIFLWPVPVVGTIILIVLWLQASKPVATNEALASEG
jgi:uncharacterized membrane protein YhaH (DUF805 family)